MAKLPKSYIKKYGISKKAWREYRKTNKGGTTKNSTRKRKPKVVRRRKPKVVRRRRTYRKKKRRTTKDKRMRLGVVLPTIWRTFVDPIFGDGQHHVGAYNTWKATKDVGKSAREYVKLWLANYTGYDIDAGFGGIGGFGELGKTYGSLLLGWGAGKAADKFGVNREMKKIPFAGKYIKL